MNPFGSLVQKAFYLGVGLATMASEKAGATLTEIRDQATKLADDLVERGEMTTEEAKKFVDDLMRQAQQPQEKMKSDTTKAPRTIDILNDDEALANAKPDDVQQLKNKVQELQEELKRIQNK